MHTNITFESKISSITKGRRALKDPSMLSLILANFLFGVYFIYVDGTIGELLLVYWSQNVIIGVINCGRILKHKNFGKMVESSQKVKGRDVLLFLFHYGGFHALYLLFLFDFFPQNLNGTLIGGVLIFGVHHALSFLLHSTKESMIERSRGRLMLFPYIRIIPMHLLIILCGFFSVIGFIQSPILICVFLLLKTVADGVMHLVEHAVPS